MANNKSKKVKEILSRIDMFETNLVKMQAALEGMKLELEEAEEEDIKACLLYTSPSPRDLSTSRMPSSA